MKIIYKPKGRALEYSQFAANFVTGCTHACKFCFVPDMPPCKQKGITREQFYSGFTIKKNVLENLEKDLKKFDPKKGPVLLHFTSDPYQVGAETLTRKALELFRQYKVPFTILTKGGTRAAADFDLYFPGCEFASTLTFINDNDSKEIEPGAALPWDRIEALRQAKSAGIRTWVSFEPVLDSDQVFDLYEKTKDFVDLYKVGKVSGYPSRVKDWNAFGMEIIRRMDADKKAYYIKDDLKKMIFSIDNHCQIR